MLLIWTLLLGCWSSGECVVVPEPEARECEVSEDCALAWVDCAQSCTCAAVLVGEVEAIEAQTAADCGTRHCDDEVCANDCKDRRVAVCVRGRCESYEGGADSGGF
ncbi:MAG: hypothetical protein H6741_29340 [Alphaproteobacteria bacterium]|nr:hypothetical protein [Alphaproteobacteria bacterium]MCB9796825.1 hypothetical protein [Alphaproteobacteria bacterium]